MGILNAILAIPGLGGLLKWLGNLLTHAVAYQKGKSDQSRNDKLAGARMQIDLDEERRESDRRISDAGVDAADRRLRKRLHDAARRQ